MKEKLIEAFLRMFGEGGGVRSYFAPGRVNLIGEHTDYNGGHVFPCALTIGTYAIVRKREDRRLVFYSENFEETGVVESSLDDLVYHEKAGWTNYPKGVIWAFLKKGFRIDSGFEMLLYGNIPYGSGLSSSASVEVVTGVMLRDLTEEAFEENKELIKSEVRRKRTKHAVYENRRTLKAAEALRAGDLAEFGRLMNASHVSLRDDYEVTGKELDTLVEAAWRQPGVIGSRMTGAGFGGCTVSIVKNDAVDAFIENVGKEYVNTIGYAADFYVVEIGDGGRAI